MQATTPPKPIAELRELIQQLASVDTGFETPIIQLAQKIGTANDEKIERKFSKYSQRLFAQLTPEKLRGNLRYLIVYCLFLETHVKSSFLPSIYLSDPANPDARIKFDKILAEMANPFLRVKSSLDSKEDGLIQKPLCGDETLRLLDIFLREGDSPDFRNEMFSSLFNLYLLSLHFRHESLLAICRDLLGKEMMKRTQPALSLHNLRILWRFAVTREDSALKAFCLHEYSLHSDTSSLGELKEFINVANPLSIAISKDGVHVTCSRFDARSLEICQKIGIANLHISHTSPELCMECLRSLPTLRHFKLENGGWVRDALTSFADALSQHPTLLSLELEGCDLDEEEFKFLIGKLSRLTSLQNLRLPGNRLGIKAAISLSEVIVNMVDLRKVGLGNNHLGPNEIKILLLALPKTLTSLELDHNDLAEEGTLSCCTHLGRFPQMQVLSLAGNSSSEKAVKSMAEAAKAHLNQPRVIFEDSAPVPLFSHQLVPLAAHPPKREIALPAQPQARKAIELFTKDECSEEFKAALREAFFDVYLYALESNHLALLQACRVTIGRDWHGEIPKRPPYAHLPPQQVFSLWEKAESLGDKTLQCFCLNCLSDVDSGIAEARLNPEMKTAIPKCCEHWFSPPENMPYIFINAWGLRTLIYASNFPPERVIEICQRLNIEHFMMAITDSSQVSSNKNILLKIPPLTGFTFLWNDPEPKNMEEFFHILAHQHSIKVLTYEESGIGREAMQTFIQRIPTLPLTTLQLRDNGVSLGLLEEESFKDQKKVESTYAELNYWLVQLADTLPKLVNLTELRMNLSIVSSELKTRNLWRQPFCTALSKMTKLSTVHFPELDLSTDQHLIADQRSQREEEDFQLALEKGNTKELKKYLAQFFLRIYLHALKSKNADLLKTCRAFLGKQKEHVQKILILKDYLALKEGIETYRDEFLIAFCFRFSKHPQRITIQNLLTKDMQLIFSTYNIDSSITINSKGNIEFTWDIQKCSAEQAIEICTKLKIEHLVMKPDRPSWNIEVIKKVLEVIPPLTAFTFSQWQFKNESLFLEISKRLSSRHNIQFLRFIPITGNALGLFLRELRSYTALKTVILDCNLEKSSQIDSLSTSLRQTIPSLTQLEVLVINGFPFNSSKEALHFPTSLAKVYLLNCKIPKNMVLSLAQAVPHAPVLKKLDLSKSSIDLEDATTLVQACTSTTKRMVLNLSGCNLPKTLQPSKNANLKIILETK